MAKLNAAQAWVSWFGLAAPATAGSLGTSRRALVRPLAVAIGSAFFVVASVALALGTVSRQLEARAQAVAIAGEPAAFTPGEFITPQLTAGYLGR